MKIAEIVTTAFTYPFGVHPESPLMYKFVVNITDITPRKLALLIAVNVLLRNGPLLSLSSFGCLLFHSNLQSYLTNNNK